MDKAVVLLSGGMDSTTCLAMALEAHDEVLALSFDYGQSHAIELEAAARIAQEYEVTHRILKMPDIFSGSGASALMGEVDQPDLTYKEIEEAQGVSPTYVPYRNGNLLSMAAAVALTVDASWVYVGVHAEDARSFAYPDCTVEWVGAQAAAIYIGTYHKVRLRAPLQYMTKSDVIEAALELGVDLSVTHSCYKGGGKACGTCPTCVERIAAFRRLGLFDRAPYVDGVDQMDDRYKTHHGGTGL